MIRDAELKWPKQAEAMRQRLASECGDVLLYPRPWTQPPDRNLTPKLLGCGISASPHAATTRETELLDLAFVHRCRELGMRLREACEDPEARAKVAAGLWVNMSQAISRKPWAHGSIPTYATSSRWYSYEHDEKVEPEEAFALYGRAIGVDQAASTRDVQDLVGNCMAAQTIGAVVHSVLLVLGRRIPDLWDLSHP